MNLRKPLKRLVAFASAAAVGLTAAAMVASPAEATGSHKNGGGHHRFDVTTNVWGERECKSGEWHVTWHLEDTTETKKSYGHKVREVETKVDNGGWSEPDFEAEATLKVGADVPKSGEGELTAVQILPGDTEWVKLKAKTDWWRVHWNGHPQWGHTDGKSDKLYLGECTPEPSAVTFSSDCTQYTIVLEVPENGVPTDFEITTNGGNQGTTSVDVNGSETVTVPIDFDGGPDPWVEVSWASGTTKLVLEDYEDECVGDPVVVVSADCIEYMVGLTVPADGLTTDFQVTTSGGVNETKTVNPGDEEVKLYYLIEFDGENQPWINVAWGDEDSAYFQFDDYDAECIAYSDLTGSIWSDCDGVGYEFLNTATQNGGVTFGIRLEPTEGDNVELTLAPEDFVEGTIPAASTDSFSVDIYVDDELEETYEWMYDAEACDEAPADETTPVAKDQLPATGSSLTIAIASAAALALAGAVLFFIVRRRRTAENW